MKKLLFLMILFGLMIIAVNDVSAQKTNIALNKPTTQSSLYSNAYPASKAVDGITTGRDGDFTHTKDEKNPWWQVDLEAVYDINEIVIWNRTDCCWDRLQNFYVMLSDIPITNNSTTKNVVSKGSFTGNYPNVLLNFGSNGKKGRYLRIFMENDTVPLSLAEVQVFAKEKSNPTAKAEKSPETQISKESFIGTWTVGDVHMIFNQSEVKYYTDGNLDFTFRYRVVNNSTIEVTNEDGSKNPLNMRIEDNNTKLVWDIPYRGKLVLKRESNKAETAEIKVFRNNLIGTWTNAREKLVVNENTIVFYLDNVNYNTTPYSVLDEKTVKFTDANGKDNNAIMSIEDNNTTLVWHRPDLGKNFIFKRVQ